MSGMHLIGSHSDLDLILPGAFTQPAAEAGCVTLSPQKGG